MLYSEERRKMDYVFGVRRYFEGVVREWLNSNRGNSQDPIFQSYQRTAMKYQHDPFNPPTIVSNVDLCWNLTLMNNIIREKELLKDKVESNMSNGYLSMSPSL